MNFKLKAPKILAAFFISASLIPGPIPALDPIGQEDITGVTQTLLKLIDEHENQEFTEEDYESTSLGQIIRLATPAGYRIKLRYLNLGVPLVEALRSSRDPDLRKRLIELVQWSREPEVRAQALITLAGLHDPSHLKYFKSGILDSNVGIRFASVEALQKWGREGSMDLLKRAMTKDWSPLMRVFAAQAVLSLGDKSGLDTLWKEVKNPSWVVRGMSARFLGDYANPADYQKLVDLLRRENDNNFVIAEYSIAALKLISQKGDKVSYSPFAQGWKDNDLVSYSIGRDGVIELEPLVIIPPRLNIPQSLQVAATINNKLLNLIKYNLEQPLDAVQEADPIREELNSMLTPAGFALKTRYAEISYLVVEALGGTTDPLLRNELDTLARDNENPLVRATAMLSMAYNKNDQDISLVSDALRHDNVTLRFGAMEAVEVGRFRQLLPDIAQVANSDPSPALQAYAAELLSKFGDPMGRQIMLTRLSERDWPARAMTYRSLSRFGDQADYPIILSRLPNETNPFVQAEICLGILRLAPLE